MFFKLVAAIWFGFSLLEMFGHGNTDRATYAILVAILNMVACLENEK